MIIERVDAEKPFLGLTHFNGDYITTRDVGITNDQIPLIKGDLAKPGGGFECLIISEGSKNYRILGISQLSYTTLHYTKPFQEGNVTKSGGKKINDQFQINKTSSSSA